MRCDRVEEGLWAFLDGEMSFWRQRRIAAHLRHCARCRERLSSRKELRARLVALAPLGPAPARRPASPSSGFAAPALACTVLAVLAALLFHPVPPDAAVSVAAPVPPPLAVAVVSSPVPARPSLRSRPVRRRHRGRRSRRPRLPEQIVVVALRPPVPAPRTLVHDSTDEEGGTIHIESTFSAAYVAALQSQLPSSGE